VYLASRSDAVLHGAHAINAYCEPERMTADVDILSTDAARLAEDVRGLLGQRFHIAVRVHEVVPGGFRVYQVREPKNRQLVDVRQVEALPPHRSVEGVRVLEPTELAARKAVSMVARRGQVKGLTDRADLHRLLLVFPELRSQTGAVPARMRALGASEAALAAWNELLSQPLAPDDDADV
jgi:hypothetical protein